uniref:histidine kinase n=1 Tax=Fundidesulfovibrio putealis TaxID=270496 RepID=A0A7C4AI04_9BACT
MPAPQTPSQTGPPYADTRQDGVVRLSADALGRLTGLAGQALVEAGLLGKSMERLRAGQSDLADCADILSGVRAALPDGGLKDELGRAQLLLKEAMTGHSKGVCSLQSLSRRMETHAERLYRSVLASRMRPFGEGARPLPRLVRDTGRELGRQAAFALEGASTSVDRDILERLEAPLMHLARNAVDHGLETPQERLAAGKPEQGLVTLSARHLAGTLEVRLSDDGRGIDLERLRAAVVERALADADMAARMTDQELLDFLFLPGFTTTHNLTHVSGRGVGLDVVKTMTQQVGGSVRVESAPGRGTTFILRLPVSRSVIRALVVRVNQEPYALPLARIGRVALPADQELVTVGGQRFLSLDDGDTIGIAPAAMILGMPPSPPDPSGVPVVVLESDGVRFGLEVDALLGERDLVVHPLDHRLGKIPGVAAASVLDDGMPVLILDEADLLRSLTALLAEGRSTLLAPGADTAQERTTRRVLVVDDSLTVREVERQLLAGRGYDVVTAVDGMEGLALARMGGFDLVVTDVDMPRMTGIELTRRIKADPALARTPVMIVSYKDRQEDRMAGLQAGADYYLPKSGFKDEALLQAVFDLIGEP